MAATNGPDNSLERIIVLYQQELHNKLQSLNTGLLYTSRCVEETAPTAYYLIQLLTNLSGTPIRSATWSGVIPLYKKRWPTTFIFSPTSILCLSGS